jgi:hypothetical protein
LGIKRDTSWSYFAKDLSPEQRLAIESLLGRNMSDKEAIAIRAYEPASPQETDVIFEEAMRQTRPHYRTHR